MTRLVTTCLAAIALTGCQAHHYVVAKDETPLYRSPRGDEVMTRMPLYHHEPLDEVPPLKSGRVRVPYKGRMGYAPRHAVDLFSYLHPEWDGGDDRYRAVREALREVELSHVGREWPDHVVGAIRSNQVVKGMTRRQVELAWGWPLTVEPGGTAGEERWVYRNERTKLVRHWINDPWFHSAWGPTPYPCDSHWRSGYWDHGGYITVRLPVTEERTVTIGPDGTVIRVKVRTYTPS